MSESFESINPTTEEVFARHPAHAARQVEERIDRADRAAPDWAGRSLPERSELLVAAARRLEERRSELAELAAREMGKPITAGRAEIDKCAWVCRHYAEHATEYLSPESISTDARKSYVRCDPLGPILAIMPWNFPFWQVFRFAAPALMAGNVGLLKHASNVCGCALAIEELFVESGFPPHCFQTLLIPSGAVERVVADGRVRAVTLTGSDAAGRAVASAAGKNIKKTVLELGGSDPFIVLGDADLERAAELGAKSRMLNSGQSCISAKRFIVEQPVVERFVELLVAAIRALIVGNPLDGRTDIGPLAREDLLRDLQRQVDASVRGGSRLVLGGGREERRGYFFSPTVLRDGGADLPAFTEETFGPLAAVATVEDESAAIELANATHYGLGASVWTTDSGRGEAIAARLEAGSVFVNGLVKSDPRLPFGGVKLSGYGRELGRDGIRELVNRKTVWLA